MCLMPETRKIRLCCSRRLVRLHCISGTTFLMSILCRLCLPQLLSRFHLLVLHRHAMSVGCTYNVHVKVLVRVHVYNCHYCMLFYMHADNSVHVLCTSHSRPACSPQPRQGLLYRQLEPSSESPHPHSVEKRMGQLLHVDCLQGAV